MIQDFDPEKIKVEEDYNIQLTYSLALATSNEACLIVVKNKEDPHEFMKIENGAMIYRMLSNKYAASPVGTTYQS